VPAGAHILFIVPPGENKAAPNGLQALSQLFDANNAPVSGVELTASFGNKACPDAGALRHTLRRHGLERPSPRSPEFPVIAAETATPPWLVSPPTPRCSRRPIPFNIQGFCPAGNLTTLRRENTVALLPNGRVLILGALTATPSLLLWR